MNGSFSCDIANESLFGADTDSGEDESLTVSSLINKDMFSFMHWNVNGLMSKIHDVDFISFVTRFHFVCLVETFLSSFDIDFFYGFKSFCCPSLKLSKSGRPSGGVVCLIKKELMPFIKQIQVKSGFFLLFVIDKHLFGIVKDVLYVCAYTPPEGSPFYSFVSSDSDGISMLENCILDNALLENDYYVILSGDLNSRTSNMFNSFSVDSNLPLDLITKENSDFCRQSQDKIVNGFGKTLLHMCNALDLSILNGMCYSDHEGRFTYISDFGCSVIDYFLISNELLINVWDNCDLKVIDRTDTQHMPVVLSVGFPICFSAEIIKDNDISIFKYVWQEEKVSVFKDILDSENIKLKLDQAIYTIDVDINDALSIFNECLKEAAECMNKRVRLGGQSVSHSWFDEECKDKRRLLRKLLKVFRKSQTEKDRLDFCKTRREFKNLIFCKKKQHNSKMINTLLNTISNQKKFWETLRKVIPKRKHIRNNISIEDWFLHFKRLLENDDVTYVEESNEDCIDDEDLEFNRPISTEEVLLALRKLKPNKSSGTDGIISEMIKNAGNVITPFLVRLLNTLFDKGVYPDSWSESIILPLHKKGDINNVENYRGISLCNICSKVYGFIINRRLQAWAEEYNITGEHQAGFKSGYSSIDHIFTLFACIQKQLLKNSKLYVAFIDFEKAFDTINRNLLWPILLKNGIKGKLLKCIKSMYAGVKARVRSGSQLSQTVLCGSGVKQGDICSPILFSLFINELAVDVIKNGYHGVSFPMDAFQLFILLLADDVVLLSETIIGLQRQLNSLHDASSKLGLKVNKEKSSIVVFRKGGYLGSRERWFINGISIPIVNSYKYLGIYFSTKLSFTLTCKDLSSKAKKSLICIVQRLRALSNNSLDVFVKLFDGQVQPTLQYGSEIWAFEKAAIHCEKVHLLALKRLLGVDLHTPNDLVYKELNRYPIILNSKINSLRYWFKLVEMSDNRLPKKAYLLLRDLDTRGKNTWVTKIRECLFFVWFWICVVISRCGTNKSFFEINKTTYVRLPNTKFV